MMDTAWEPLLVFGAGCCLLGVLIGFELAVALAVRRERKRGGR